MREPRVLCPGCGERLRVGNFSRHQREHFGPRPSPKDDPTLRAASSAILIKKRPGQPAETMTCPRCQARHLVSREKRHLQRCPGPQSASRPGRSVSGAAETHTVQARPVAILIRKGSQAAPVPFAKPKRTIPHHLTSCPQCGAGVRPDRLARHVTRVHRVMAPAKVTARPQPASTSVNKRSPRAPRRATPEPGVVIYRSDGGRPAISAGRQSIPPSPPVRRPGAQATHVSAPKHPDRLPGSDSEWWRD